MARTNGLGSNPLLNTDTSSFDVDKERAELGIEEPGETRKTKGRPKNDSLIRESGTQEGLTKDWTRATFIMNVDTLDRLKDYAYTERISLKEAVDDILKAFLDDYQKTHELLKHRGR